MDNAQRKEYESLILHSETFEQDPNWHFVFIENSEILSGLLELLPEMSEGTAHEALLGFARVGDCGAAADTAAALYRVYCVAGEYTEIQYSSHLTQYFQTAASRRIAEAFGVPERYLCTGALLFFEETDALQQTAKKEVQWNVFSYIR